MERFKYLICDSDGWCSEFYRDDLKTAISSARALRRIFEDPKYIYVLRVFDAPCVVIRKGNVSSVSIQYDEIIRYGM